MLRHPLFWTFYLCFLGPLGSQETALLDLPADLPHNYGVLGARLKIAADTLMVSHVTPLGPADTAGLRQGDRLLAALPYRMRTVQDFSRYIKSLLPDTQVELLIVRNDSTQTLTCMVTDVRRLYALMGEQARDSTPLQQRHRQWRARSGKGENLAKSTIDSLGAGTELENLQRAFAIETRRYAADCRLQDVHFGLVNPLKNGQIAADLAAAFSNTALDSTIARMPPHLDLSLAPSPVFDTAATDSLLASNEIDPSLYQSLFRPFLEAGLLAELAFAELDSVEQNQLFSGIPALLKTFSEDFLLGEGDREQTASHMHTLRLAKRVDLAYLFAAALKISQLTDPAALKEIRHRARKKPLISDQLPPAFQGGLLFAAPTPWGWFLVGDKGPNFYGANAALIVDLGGDDTYLNNCGAPILLPNAADSVAFQRQSPAGLLIDFAGDDRYIGNGWGATGSAVGGVGLLLDLQGDDLYQGDRLTQAAAFCGVGLLCDRRGNDTYLAQEWAQGAAFFGAGALVDDGGTDLYSAAQFSQAFGGTRALALLRDWRGDDTYLADRKTPSGYGTSDIYSGWSQGVGCGFRGYSSGGIGLLLDAEGRDTYQAGNFSQGLGYFFGLGILVDHRGDDAYRSSRYAQGASAHQAIGVLIDERGDDTYQAQMAAAQAGAWDAGIAWLCDLDGNDSYTAQHLAQGAAAMNGLALLLDANGRDTYQAQSGQAQGSSHSYWGGRGARNLGLLIDLGTASDTYNLADRRNSTTFSSPGTGLFSDR